MGKTVVAHIYNDYKLYSLVILIPRMYVAEMAAVSGS